MKDTIIPSILIRILADGKIHSRKQLEKHLGIHIAAINEHIQTLHNWGIRVLTISKKGYRLLEPMRLLDETLIRKQINNGNITVLPVVNSTNQYLLDQIHQLHSGDSCIAEYQEKGRGRRGRKWISPFGANTCLSMFWHLAKRPASGIALSLVIGIVLARVLEEFGADNVRIKWPNDLYLNDRKLAGILIELITQTGNSADIIIGVGINIEMREIFTNIFNQSWITLQETGASLDRNALTICLINKFRSSLTLFEEQGLSPFIPLWERFDNFHNRPVRLIFDKKEIYGVSRGINIEGALMLERNGIISPWIGEEISLRNAS